jgi:hypothetical protein
LQVLVRPHTWELSECLGEKSAQGSGVNDGTEVEAERVGGFGRCGQIAFDGRISGVARESGFQVASGSLVKELEVGNTRVGGVEGLLEIIKEWAHQRRR